MAAIARTALDVFPLDLGGNTFDWTSDRSTSFAVLDAFTKAGGNVVDTADVYSAWGEGHTGGESETVLGEWLAARGNRDDVVLATQAGSLSQRPHRLGLPGRAGAGAHGRPRSRAHRRGGRSPRPGLAAVRLSPARTPAAPPHR